MPKKACIYGSNNLTPEDNAELIQLYEEKLDSISSTDLDLANTTVEKQALFQALIELTEGALGERVNITNIAQEHGVVLKPRTLISVVGKPTTLVKTAPIESEKLVVTNQNIPDILERLENIPEEKLSNPEIIKRRATLIKGLNILINTPEKVNEKNLSEVNTRLNKLTEVLQITTPSNAAFVQVGRKGQEQTTGNLSEDLLIDGLVANADKENRTPVSARTSIASYLVAKGSTTKTNVLRTVNNMFSRLMNTDTKNDVLEELPTLTDEQVAILTTLADFTEEFRTNIVKKLRFFSDTTIKEFLMRI